MIYLVLVVKVIRVEIVENLQMRCLNRIVDLIRRKTRSTLERIPIRITITTTKLTTVNTVVTTVKLVITIVWYSERNLMLMILKVIQMILIMITIHHMELKLPLLQTQTALTPTLVTNSYWTLEQQDIL